MSAPTFSPITDEVSNWIETQLEGVKLFVAAMSPVDAGKPVTLEALDRAWAAWLPNAGTDEAQINSVIDVVGVQFGQFLVDKVGFEWTYATDEYGTDLAILALPGKGDMLIYPTNFVAKRWERDEDNFLAASFDALKRQHDKVARQYSD